MEKYYIDNKDMLEIRQMKMARKQKAVENCQLMHDKSKFKNEANKILFYKNEEIKAEKELASCTFKPKVNKTILKIDSCTILSRQTIHERSIQWKNKKEKTLARSRSVVNADEYTYKPNISRKNLDTIFNTKKRVDFAECEFFERLNRARYFEEEKRNKLDILCNSEPKFSTLADKLERNDKTDIC
jgi:hypothetical protein